MLEGFKIKAVFLIPGVGAPVIFGYFHFSIPGFPAQRGGGLILLLQRCRSKSAKSV